MTCFLSPVFGAGAQLLTDQGLILAGGTIETYQAGTSTPLATFTDSTGGTSNGTVITLDSYGRPPNEIWLQGGSSYKFIVKNSAGVQQGTTYDNISGVNDTSAVSGSAAEWIDIVGTLGYINATSFSVVGDITAQVSKGRRLKFVCSGGIGYATVSASSFSAGFTTVDQVNDGLTLDSGLSAASYGLISAANPSVDSLAVTFKPTIAATSGTVAAELVKSSRGLTQISTTGTNVAYVLTPTAPLAAYAGSGPFWVKFHTAPGAAPTINISGLGAKNLRQWSAVLAAVADPSLDTSQTYQVQYDATLDAVLVMTTTVNGFGGAVTLKDLAAFAKVASANGYQTLPGGIIIQWGTSASIPLDTAGSVVFPLAFPTNCFVVIVQAATDNGVGAGAQYSWGTKTKSLTGFDINNDATASVFDWIAIGN